MPVQRPVSNTATGTGMAPMRNEPAGQCQPVAFRRLLCGGSAEVKPCGRTVMESRSGRGSLQVIVRQERDHDMDFRVSQPVP